MDICKSLPDDTAITLKVEEGKALIKAGRSRFTLATLPAADFPNVEDGPGAMSFAITQNKLDLVIDAGWVSKDVVCKGVPSGKVSACN